jgi:UDP-glucose 4-epimerase
MKTLVTGAAGFIGSELVRQLIQAGQSVVAFDNLATGSWDNLAGLEPVECITGDIRDAEAVGRALRDVASVYHLACLNLRQSLLSPGESHDVNATGTLTVLEAARGAAVERFVYVSTSEVYGTARTVPMSEEHPTFPATVYGASKLAGEAYARAFHATYGLPVALVRPFNSYGPRCHHEGSSGEVIPKFLLRARSGLPLVIFGDGRQTRDFTFVTDTARGILLAGTVPNAVGRTFNLGSGIEISMTALAGRIAPGVAVIHEPERPGDVRRLLADSTAARETLGFEPRVSFDEGLAILATWYELQSIPLPVLLQQEVVHNWRSG